MTLIAPTLQTIVEDCAKAAKSNDARDKYFWAYVGGADAGDAKALRSEVPSLQAHRIQVHLMRFALAAQRQHRWRGNMRVSSA